ncbi:hypothetical protein SAMN05421797_1023 [Maribacter ulvicola]|uniref:Uncharacterized protein n=1 Tax=Maribacter ulvicola TaxID=228959 RepID=A0A1N6TJU7_9FLAO|nr:hypothetical protein SAMN05421797_1023 [Maribacter ulvicola]
MSVRNLDLPKSPELIGDISIDSIRLLINENLPDLSPLKSNDIVFRISSLIGFKDKDWDKHFKQSCQIH